ncbi:MAG: hypothetical protein ACI8WB_005819 [Phenylobacterium sp.]
MGFFFNSEMLVELSAKMGLMVCIARSLYDWFIMLIVGLIVGMIH